MARIAGRRQGLRAVELEQRAACMALQVQAQGLLLVQRRAQPGGQLAQAVAGLRQITLLEAKQAGDLALAHGVGAELGDLAADVDAQGDAAGVVRVGLRHQLEGGTAQHQGLAAAHVQRHRLVGALHGMHAHLGADAAHQLVALVQQLVGAVAAVGGRGDGQVELGHLAGKCVDLGNAPLHVVHHVGLQRLDLVGRRAGERGEVFQPPQHRLAGGQVRRIGRHIGEGVEDLGRGLAQAGLAAAKHLFQLRQHVAPHAIGRCRRARGHRLLAEEHAGRAGNGGDGDTAPEVARAVVGAARRGQFDRLA